MSDAGALREAFARSLGERYELTHEIGRGGMGLVFLAADRKHDREVAIKVLLPELSQSIGAERFQREIRVLARLQGIPILDRTLFPEEAYEAIVAGSEGNGVHFIQCQPAQFFVLEALGLALNARRHKLDQEVRAGVVNHQQRVVYT